MLRQWSSQWFSQFIRPMTLRHHLVTMTNGESLAKINWRKFIHSSHFLCGSIPFISQVVMHSRSTSFSTKHKDAKQDNSINKQLPCNYNFNFLAASKWQPCKAASCSTRRPCTFQAAFCPNDYNIYWTTADNDHHSILNDLTETSIWH